MPVRSASVDLLAAIAAGKPTLQILLKVTLPDSSVLGFVGPQTESLTFEAVEYLPGLNISNISMATGLGVDNLEVSGLFKDGVITAINAAAGEYDSSRYSLDVIDYENIAGGVMNLDKGRVRKFDTSDGMFVVSLASNTHLLQVNVGRLTAPTCSVKVFGDSQCGIDINGNHPTLGLPYKANITIASVANRLSFTVGSLSYVTAFFDNGKLTWTGGNNAGVLSEVKLYTLSGSTGTFTLQEPPRKAALVAGDTAQVIFGCNRTGSKCMSVENFINFRGFPYLKGLKKQLTSR